MRAPGVVEADPVANDPYGVLQGLEAMAFSAPKRAISACSRAATAVLAFVATRQLPAQSLAGVAVEGQAKPAAAPTLDPARSVAQCSQGGSPRRAGLRSGAACQWHGAGHASP